MFVLFAFQTFLLFFVKLRKNGYCEVDMLAIEAVEKINLANLPMLTVIAGEDSGQYALAQEILLRGIGFDVSDLNYTRYDMREVPYQDMALDLVSLPFFADEKVVILDNFQDVTTSKKKYLQDEDLQDFERYLMSPQPTTKLIIFAQGKLDNKRRLVKLLKREGEIFELTALKEQEIRQYFTNYVQKEQLLMTRDVLDALLLKSNFDFGEVIKNIALLKAYKLNNEATLTDISDVLPKSLQDNIFDLTQLVLKKQLDRARDLVHDLTLQGEDEVKLIAVMLGQFRLYMQVKILQQEGYNENQIVTKLSELLERKVNPYQVKFTLRDSQGLSLPFLKKILVLLIDTDYQIKTGVCDKHYLFELALLKIATA